MMILPIEDLIKKDPLLVSLISDKTGLKFEEFDANSKLTPPYVMWQIIHAAGDENLSGISQMDEVVLQLDVYSTNKAQNRQIAQLVRKAIEQECQVEGFTGNIREGTTNLWRISLDTRWFEEP